MAGGVRQRLGLASFQHHQRHHKPLLRQEGVGHPTGHEDCLACLHRVCLPAHAHLPRARPRFQGRSPPPWRPRHTLRSHPTTALERKLARGIVELIDAIIDEHLRAAKALKNIKAVSIELGA